MPTLREQLIQKLPSILPKNPDEAINGTDLIDKVKPLLSDTFSDNSIRQHFSVLANEPSSPIARVEKGQGYYLRLLTNNSSNASLEKPNDSELGRGGQLEEKFRAIFIRSQETTNRFPMYVEHTKSVKSRAGQNKWKYPDVIVLDWEVGEATDTGYVLAKELLEVKKSLGEQPFKLTSVELKFELTTASFRESFFQTVSNSKWAHVAILAVAGKIEDEILAKELRRLGASYDVNVVSYGMEISQLESFPSAQEISNMDDSRFDKEIVPFLSIKTVATGKERSTLDWEHIRDLRTLNGDFDNLFRWVAYCLDKKKAYKFDDYQKISKLENKYG